MIKRTLYFSNPAWLHTSNEQLVVERKEEGNISVPIEDIGLVILDNQQVSISQALMAKLLENNVALITCDSTHHPVGLMLNLEGNTLQSQKYQLQVDASQPLKKQIWAQTVAAKIQNQAAILKEQKIESGYLTKLAGAVKSGDSTNLEAKAASYYWKRVFPDYLEFTRSRYGPPPNNLLNYGYAILRAMVARALVGSGLLPTLGVFHRNQYNAYCLADDIMEPYRPIVDRLVYQMVRMNGKFIEMTPAIKKQFLELPVLDVYIENKKSPLQNAITRTTASLVKTFEGTQRKVLYPEL